MADSAAGMLSHLDEVDELRGQGADRDDPVRFRFIEALAMRAQAYRGETRARLDARLVAALQDFRQQSASSATPSSSEDSATQVGAAPLSVAGATSFDGGGASNKSNASNSPLAELATLAARMNAAHVPDDVPARGVAQDVHPQALSGAIAPVGELKALRYFRESWAKLSLEQQLAEALAQTPDNAGPLNSQLLVLRALQRMRDLSPAYLARFMAHADALLWLERTGRQTASPAASSVASSASRQKKNPR